MDVVFADNGLIGKGEHSYALIKKVGEALTRRGFAHRTFGAKAIDPSIVEELGAIPHFNYSLYFRAVLRRTERGSRRSLFDRLRGVDADPNLPSERETFRLLSASFAEDLAALPEDVWSADNLLVVPAISYNELAALIKALVALSPGRRPHVVCQLMFSPNWTSWGRNAKIGAGLYRKAFALARPLIGRTLFFTAENEAIARLYHRKFRIDVDILPAPFGDVTPAAPVAGTPTFGFFGYSKCEKGFHLLPWAIEICRAQDLAANFTIQVQHHGWEPATVAAEAHLRRLPQVRLIEGVLSEEDYIAETAGSTRCCCPMTLTCLVCAAPAYSHNPSRRGADRRVRRDLCRDLHRQGRSRGRSICLMIAQALADADHAAFRPGLPESHVRAAALAQKLRAETQRRRLCRRSAIASGARHDHSQVAV